MATPTVFQELINLRIQAPALPLKLDGNPGPLTYAVFNSLPLSDREHILSCLCIGESESGIMNHFIPSIKLSMAEFVSLVADVALVHGDGDPVLREYLLLMATTENVVTSDGSFIIEHAGTFRGIAQFNKVTWEAVMPKGTFESLSANPVTSLVAAIKLWYANKKSFRAEFGSKSYSPSVGYLYHNQGASQAAKYLKSGRMTPVLQSQSAVAKVIANQALKDIGTLT